LRGINVCGISGHVASDILFSATRSGDSACSFRFAIDQGHKSTVFIRVNAYGGNVDVIRDRQMQKGDYAVIDGELMNRQGHNDVITEMRCGSIVIIPRNS